MAQERLYIENIWIPLTSSLNPSITKSITDITEPQARRATYSKTVAIPRSKEADQIFSHIFEFNAINLDFNPSARADVRYECDSEIILEGYIRLNKIGRTNNNEITYDCTMFSTAGDFMATIATGYLTDLYESTSDFEGLDIYDHVLNRDIQQLSWDTSIVENYPASVPFEFGKGYVYALVDYGFSSDATTFKENQIAPSIYEKEYLLRIISWAGYTLQAGGWVDTDDVINHLIIPASPECYQLTNDDIEDREFAANTPQLTSTGTTTSNNLPKGSLSSPDLIKFTNEVTDPGLNYNPATGQFTVVSAGTYDLNTLVEVNATFDPSTGTPVKTICDIHGYVMFFLTPFSTGVPVQADAIPFYITSDDTYSTGTRSTSSIPSYPDSDYMINKAWGKLSQTPPLARTVNPPDRYQLTATGIPLNVGDIVDVRWKAGVFMESSNPFTYISKTNELFEDAGATKYNGDVTLTMSVGSFFNKVVNTTMTGGNTLQMSDVIPKNVKMVDYIQSLLRPFNLIIDTNPLNPKELILKTKDEFYDNDPANALNIHELIDRSKPIDSMPVSTLNVKRYTYGYKPDNDYWNSRYTQNHQEVYGDRRVDVETEFATADKKTEIIFSPTCMVGLPGNNRVLPTIYAVDDYNQAKTTKHNIRRLYYAGLKPCLNAWAHTKDAGVFGIVLVDYFTSYPYAGHWDDPFNPTLDINFGLVKEVFYDDNIDPIVFTDNNLVNKYHSKDIRQLTDPESRIVKCHVNIRPLDFVNFTFDKLYYWDFAYWRLQEISNYNPARRETTECTFLKLVSVPDFVATSITATGKPEEMAPPMEGGNVDLTETTASKGTRSYSQPDNNNYSSRSVEVKGEYNYISQTAKNVEIYGDSNKVFSEANNIKINGSGNTIEAGVENVTLINTNDLTITESDVTYINGVEPIFNPKDIESITSSQDWDPSVLMYLVDASAGNVSIDLDVTAYTFNEGQELHLYRLDNVAANLCRVTVTGCNIDIVGTTKGIGTQYDSFTLKYHDGNFYTIN
jgi:hypothetical protein